MAGQYECATHGARLASRVSVLWPSYSRRGHISCTQAPVGEDGVEVEEDDSLVTPNLVEDMSFFEL